MEIINLTYKSTNCYLVKYNSSWIMIDAWWPDTMSQFLNLLKQKDIHINDIKYLIVTHFHPDHAGLAQNLKDLGVILIVHESQVNFANMLNEFFKKNPKMNFKDIDTRDNLVMSSEDSRTFLKNLGLDGELIKTPGHSDDSISLIIDGCCVFIGDLPGLSIMEAYEDQVIKDSWKLIEAYNVEKIYPAHGDSYTLKNEVFNQK